jgi:beta-1,4-mannooligosaccharide/beta-1,4-mannosyl-N-acetylglucosamine phosphorylase
MSAGNTSEVNVSGVGLSVEDGIRASLSQSAEKSRNRPTRRVPQTPPWASPLRRHPRNAILCPEDMPIECSAVFNCGAVRHDGQFLLLLRVEDMARMTSFHVATSDDGVHFEVNPEPIHYPLRQIEKDYDAHRFDMRITPLDGAYYVCHASWLQGLGCTIAMARTTDFVDFAPVGPLSTPSNRNAVLFPEKINGLYARLERPQDTEGKGRIWISYSPDLVYWGDARPLDMPKTAWCTRKSGAGAIPIHTDKGWLEIYHTTARTASTENYYLGAMLLDLDDPSRIVAAPTRFLLQPEQTYECIGQVPNVVFTGGAIETEDGGLNVYYGGADTRICLAQSTMDELVDFCLREQ